MAIPNEPKTRREQYYAKMGGQNVVIPNEPITREEQYLDHIAKNAGSESEVSGTTPSIEVENNTFYDCGEIASLTVTDSGDKFYGIRFISGSTPTVVTLTGVTMPDDFTIEANTVYEINVKDGYGVYASWVVSE